MSNPTNGQRLVPRRRNTLASISSIKESWTDGPDHTEKTMTKPVIGNISARRSFLYYGLNIWIVRKKLNWTRKSGFGTQRKGPTET